MIYVLDTHVIVWAIENDPRLSPAAKAVLKNPASEFVLPTMGFFVRREDYMGKLVHRSAPAP